MPRRINKKNNVAQARQYESGTLNILSGGSLRLYFHLQLQRIDSDTVVSFLKLRIRQPVPNFFWDQNSSDILLYIIFDVPDGILDEAVYYLRLFSFAETISHRHPRDIAAPKIADGATGKRGTSIQIVESEFASGRDPLEYFGFVTDVLEGVTTTVPEDLNIPADQEACKRKDRQLRVIFDTAQTVRNSREAWGGPDDQSEPGGVGGMFGGLYLFLGWKDSSENYELYEPVVIRDGVKSRSYA